MAQETSTQVLDGEEFTFSQSMVRGHPATESDDPKRLLKASLITPFVAVPAALVSLAVWKKEVRDYAMSKFLPGIMAGSDKALRNVKSELLKNVSGSVLDVGAGGGGYLRYYALSSQKVTKVVLMEPNTQLHSTLHTEVKKLQDEYPHMNETEFEVRGGYLEDFGDEYCGSFDNVVLGNVLCEVPSPPEAVAFAVSLLRLGGKMFFVEHVAAPHGSKIETFQNVINPLWNAVSIGCNCNRHTLETIQATPNLETISWNLRMPGPVFMDRFIVGVSKKVSSSHSKL